MVPVMTGQKVGKALAKRSKAEFNPVVATNKIPAGQGHRKEPCTHYYVPEDWEWSGGAE